MNEEKEPKGPLADQECETCVFKMVDYSQKPCLTCIHSRPRGREDNYTKTDL